jgi:ubiquinol-cytochrome c reductase cytochrome c subunit
MGVVRIHITVAALSAGLLVGHGGAVAASIDNGKKAFVQHGCWECHGFDGQGSAVTSGGKVIADTGLPLDAFSAFVRGTNRAMPPFSAKILSDADLADIYAYLESQPKPKPVKDIPLLSANP